jgi:serine protease Do
MVASGGLALLALVLAPTVYGQKDDPVWHGRELTVLAGRGAEIGVSIRDLETSDKDRTGVVVEEVRPDSPAEKAGVKRSDVIVEFDGETVRSARQFARLVQETPPGRSVKATLVRDGRRTTVDITPSDDRTAFHLDGPLFQNRLSGLDRDLNMLVERMPPLAVNFDRFDGLPGFPGGARLGVTVEDMSAQLASFFGAKEGVLVSAVVDDSPASRAGLRAGDVITSINGDRVHNRADVVRTLHNVDEGAEVTIGIVRDKKESTVRAKMEPRKPRQGRPV